MPDADRAHKTDTAALYDRVAPTFGGEYPIFERAGRRMVALAGVAAGERVLDVACGRGASLFAAAERVGARGDAVGLDIAAAMVRETAREARARRLAHVALLRGDAETPPFPDAAFDAVLCGFAIFFLDVGRALGEFRRVLRPGGRLALSLTEGGDPRWAWYNDLLRVYQERHGIALSPATRRDVRRLDLPALLRGVGFGRVLVRVEHEEVVYADADMWWHSKWTHGSRYPLEQMSPDLLARFRAEALARLETLRESDGFRERFRMLYVIGMSPAGRAGSD